MDQTTLVAGIFVGAGLLAYVIIPGLIIIWDRVLDHVGKEGGNG